MQPCTWTDYHHCIVESVDADIDHTVWDAGATCGTGTRRGRRILTGECTGAECTPCCRWHQLAPKAQRSCRGAADVSSAGSPALQAPEARQATKAPLPCAPERGARLGASSARPGPPRPLQQRNVIPCVARSGVLQNLCRRRRCRRRHEFHCASLCAVHDAGCRMAAAGTWCTAAAALLPQAGR